MTIENIDFDDLEDDELDIDEEEKVTVSIRLPKSTNEMFAKISKRERRNKTDMGQIIIEDFITNYVERYKKKQAEKA